MDSCYLKTERLDELIYNLAFCINRRERKDFAKRPKKLY